MVNTSATSAEGSTHFFSENLLKSTSSSGAVIKLISCSISVWNIVSRNISIVALPTEMLLEKVIYRNFEHERVVDGDLAEFGDTIPAGLASAHEQRIHHVRDKEEGLEL